MYLTTNILQTADKHEADLDILAKVCYHAARLYNVGLYSVRQHFFNTQEYLPYNSNWNECKTNENYKLLLSDSAQQILRIVDRDMKSFFSLLFLKKEGKYSENVHLPRYKDKQGMMMCPVQGRSCRVQKNGKVRIGLTKAFRELYQVEDKFIELTIPKNLIGVKEFKEVRIIPQYGGKQFTISFTYESFRLPKQVSGDGYMSIDLGVDNLAACTAFSNGGTRQFLIDGRKLKNINRYYNKVIAELKSCSSKGNQGTTKRILRLMNGRKNRINDYFEKSALLIVNTCLDMGLSTLVIGYNKGQKQEIDLGSVNNQNIVSIPYHRFREKLKVRCEQHGIAYCPQEESYTSKASALDMDFIPTYGDKDVPAFSGKRVHRGLYRSSDGSMLNADINGSINILRKYLIKSNVKPLCGDTVRAFVNAPCPRVNPLAQAPSFMEG